LKTALQGNVKSADQKTDVTFTLKEKKKTTKIETKDVLYFKVIGENFNLDSAKSFLHQQGAEINE